MGVFGCRRSRTSQSSFTDHRTIPKCRAGHGHGKPTCPPTPPRTPSRSRVLGSAPRCRSCRGPGHVTTRGKRPRTPENIGALVGGGPRVRPSATGANTTEWTSGLPMDGGDSLSTLNGRNQRVAQAVVVISTETDCTVDDALLVMQQEARAHGQTLEEVATHVIRGLTRFRSRATATAPLTHPDARPLPTPQHQYEARCACGMSWRIYRDEDGEHRMATCSNCGTDTYDFRDIGLTDLRPSGRTAAPVQAVDSASGGVYFRR